MRARSEYISVRKKPPIHRRPDLTDLTLLDQSGNKRKLSDSKGIICPPAGIDPEMAIKPPPGGELKIIPPPGSPGGDPNIQPK